MLDIIVPVYNEGGNIRTLLDQVDLKIKAPKSVIIVYDFDEDNTVPVVRGIKDNYNFDVLLQKNMFVAGGKGGALNAIKTGFKSSKARIVLVVMADLSDSLDIVDRMYELITEGCDLVCGSRYMKGGRQAGGPFLKKIFSRLAGVSLHHLIKIPTHDITNSFKMYSRKVLDAFEIESTGGFELGMELTVKAYVQGMRIAEVPSQWFDRVAGKSNFKMWEWIPHYLHWYFFGIKNIWFRKKYR
jgi:glycosyltransferase involved in cell wall biosynthesis